MEKPDYDLTKAEPVKRGILTVGYIFQVSKEAWAPLNIRGKLLGPPSYKEDAANTVKGEKQTRSWLKNNPPKL